MRRECRPRYLALHDTGTLKTAKIERYLAKYNDEYALMLRKGETASPSTLPACALIGCMPESTFTPNAAGWAVYKRVGAPASLPLLPAGAMICDETCAGGPDDKSKDGECDDGGPGAEWDHCEYGTDCEDCGARTTRRRRVRPRATAAPS